MRCKFTAPTLPLFWTPTVAADANTVNDVAYHTGIHAHPYGETITLVNALAEGTPYPAAQAALLSYFGDNTITGVVNMTKAANRIKMAGSSASTDGWTLEAWVFFNRPQAPRALAVSRNTQAIYVGCENQIYKSIDEGFTWTPLPTAEGATDIMCDPLLGGVIYYWACGSVDVGKMKRAEGNATPIPMVTATRQDKFCTIDKDINSGKMLLITPTNLQKYDLTWSTIVSSVSEGCGLHMYLGGKAIYIDGSKIWYSSDYGATWTDKIGGWTGYSTPINGHLLGA
jgi:hypothetical protein